MIHCLYRQLYHRGPLYDPGSVTRSFPCRGGVSRERSAARGTRWGRMPRPDARRLLAEAAASSTQRRLVSSVSLETADAMAARLRPGIDKVDVGVQCTAWGMSECSVPQGACTAWGGHIMILGGHFMIHARYRIIKWPRGLY